MKNHFIYIFFQVIVLVFEVESRVLKSIEPQSLPRRDDGWGIKPEKEIKTFDEDKEFQRRIAQVQEKKTKFEEMKRKTPEQLAEDEERNAWEKQKIAEEDLQENEKYLYEVAADVNAHLEELAAFEDPNYYPKYKQKREAELEGLDSGSTNC